MLVRRDPLVRLTARNSRLTLANADETVQRVRSLGARTVRVFGETGVDPGCSRRASRLPELAALRFASMTRLVHWKGVHLGLRAFARLAVADAVYWVIGDGPEETRLAALARELGIADRVEFHPGLSRAEWMERLRAVDALIHPCIYNSGGTISLEAMAMGTPVICLARGGIRAQVTAEVGYPVRAESEAEAVVGLADAMREVAEHGLLRPPRGRSRASVSSGLQLGGTRRGAGYVLSIGGAGGGRHPRRVA